MRLYSQICLVFALLIVRSVVVSEANVCVPPACPTSEYDKLFDSITTDDAPFPQEELKKDLAGNAPMRKILKGQNDARAEQRKSPMLTSIDRQWIHVCPQTHTSLLKSRFWNNGTCYIMSDVWAVRCTSDYCRFTINPFEALFYHYRCFPHYRPVYFLMWCPRYHTLSYTFRYLPDSCCCHRYFCANTFWPAVDAIPVDIASADTAPPR